MDKKEIKFVFFGTSEFSVYVLEELEKEGFLPSLLITQSDKPKGRNLELTSPLTKKWAEEKGIKVLQPKKLDEKFIEIMKEESADIFVVASYGKIIPEDILNIPKYGSLNVHPSLLPDLRGPSPLQTMILEDKKETGVTIMLMDKEMDHGPILNQEFTLIDEWPSLSKLEEKLGRIGGKLLALTIPEWVQGNINEQEQSHEKATFTKILKKEDAFINLEDDDYLNYRKIMAYERLKPYFVKDGKRVVINKVKFEDGKLKILRVTPEGKKEQDYK